MLQTERLVEAFIARQLPKRDWTHEAHLRVGLWHILRFANGTALVLLRQRIRAYNEATGVANTATAGYHETITRFYLHMIRRFVESVDASRPIDELAAALLEQCGDRSLPMRYYSRDRLFSAAARNGWAEPDLAPLP